MLCICFHLTLAIVSQNPKTKKSWRKQKKQKKKRTWETGGLTALLSVQLWTSTGSDWMTCLFCSHFFFGRHPENSGGLSPRRHTVLLLLGSSNDDQGIVDGEVWHRASWNAWAIWPFPGDSKWPLWDGDLWPKSAILVCLLRSLNLNPFQMPFLMIWIFNNHMPGNSLRPFLGW